ncbi:MAG: PelD GGDEF domain-containing protein [Acidovorax sp.]|uniref:PelD GGDEF domain-containing protein n=1 Tax=Acidovorax sp. TaxID=1872122 RepID=UPI0039E38C8F
MSPPPPQTATGTRRTVAQPTPTAGGGKHLPATLLGKLAIADTRPAVMLGETVLLPVIAIALGLLVNPQDALWANAAFPWAWLAPVILALRYGPLSGLGGAFVLLAGWLAVNLGHWHQFPQVYFLGGLILVMLVGEFSSLWRARTRRAEITQGYLDQRLEHLVRQHYLLRLSHDRLEQELIGRPMSMRDALASLQSTSGSAQGPATLLRLLAQYCQLESVALYPATDEGIDETPLAQTGRMPALRASDPLVMQALETRKLCHISQALANQQNSQYLVAAPLLDLGGDIYGMLVVDEMPFFSLQDENLQTINLLLGYYTDGLATQALAAPIIEALPQCPPGFAFEAQRLAHVYRSTQVGSVIVALEFLPRSIERSLPEQILRLKRELDETWLCEGGERQVLALLMPLGSRATAEGYIARIEQWSQQSTGQSLAEAGVFPHVIVLDDGKPLDALQRIVRIAEHHA